MDLLIYQYLKPIELEKVFLLDFLIRQLIYHKIKPLDKAFYYFY